LIIQFYLPGTFSNALLYSGLICGIRLNDSDFIIISTEHKSNTEYCITKTRWFLELCKKRGEWEKVYSIWKIRWTSLSDE